jgi:proteasome accessory factor A
VTVQRIVGIETEYGVLQNGNPRANPMLMSSQVVTAYRAISANARGNARWDYLDEDPLNDARGFKLERASAHPSLLTDNPNVPAPSGDEPTLDAQDVTRPDGPVYDDPSAANAILTNGARLYVDHAHPEYSSPEVTNPRDAVIWDVAGERVMLTAHRELQRTMGLDIQLYKNNTDSKGSSYGTHENYLVKREVPFSTLVTVLTPFFVTRQIFTGSGRVGLGQHSQQSGFQISQRADFMEAEVGLETTVRRPIINTRDEPHATRERWRRLHVIIGDANLMETTTYLKVGTTNLVLWVVEHLEDHPDLAERLELLMLGDPVAEVSAVSRDLTCSEPIWTILNGEMTAISIQREYLAVVREMQARVAEVDPIPEQTQDVLARWEDVLNRLERDPMSCARDVEWVAKYRLLESMRNRHQLAWDHPKLVAMDIQWSDVRPERSLSRKLLDAGVIDRLVGEHEITNAVAHPPADTRAYFRGEAMALFGPHVTGASWDSVIFDIPGRPTLQRISMLDPWKGTQGHVGELFERHQDDPAGFLSSLLGE